MTDNVKELFEATFKVLKLHLDALKNLEDSEENYTDMAVLLGTVAGAINVLRMQLAIKPEYKNYASGALSRLLEGLPPHQFKVFTMIGDLETVGLTTKETH